MKKKIVSVYDLEEDSKLYEFWDTKLNRVNFNIPSELADILKASKRPTLIGGDTTKCLAEIVLILDMLGKKYTINDDLTYKY